MIPPNAEFHDPIVRRPANQFAKYDSNLIPSVSSMTLCDASSGTDNRSDIRASDDITLVPESNWLRGGKKYYIGDLQDIINLHTDIRSMARTFTPIPNPKTAN
jgi:hypothetical protein